MAIDVGAIMSKLEDYAKSGEGQKKMKDKIQSYRKGADPHIKSSGKTYGGGSIMTEKQMIDAAMDLISMIRSAAASANLPASVMEHVESLRVSVPYVQSDGSTSLEIYMADAPARPSLYPQKYGYVDNIVAIFNNGYTASDKVYGKWHGKYVSSLDKRQGSFFMQKAINAFMAKYSSEFDVSVELDSVYDGAW